jgi:hypothetical protein
VQQNEFRQVNWPTTGHVRIFNYPHTWHGKSTRGFSKSNKDFKVSCICSLSVIFHLETVPIFLQLVVCRAAKNCRNKTKLESKQYGDREVKLAKKIQ